MGRTGEDNFLLGDQQVFPVPPAVEEAVHVAFRQAVALGRGGRIPEAVLVLVDPQGPPRPPPPPPGPPAENQNPRRPPREKEPPVANPPPPRDPPSGGPSRKP